MARNPFDVVIIGAGHNGLTCAAFLAKAGLRPLVLEKSDRVGGCAITTAIAPGFRCATLAHRAAIDPSILRSLRLEQHGLQIVRPQALACAPAPDDRALTLWTDTARSASEIAAFSKHDAEAYPRFLESVAGVSALLRTLASNPPPSLDAPTATDLFALARTALMTRGRRRVDARRALRWMPMPVADLLAEWFETDLLRATVAAGGVFGSHLGPRSPGSAAVLLWLAAGEGQPIAPGWSARGGIGAVSEALAAAARQAGAEIRLEAEVDHLDTRDGRLAGVVLRSGEQIPTSRVVSNVDPRRTFLSFIDPSQLPPDFIRSIRGIRTRGTLAKVNYAVSTLPAFSGLRTYDAAWQRAALSGCVRLCPTLDGLERAFDAAKYGTLAEEPWIELAIPSIADPELAPDGQHVVSAYVQFAPYQLRGTTWDVERERLGDIATRTIARYAAGFERSIVARQIITPLDLERSYGLTGGHIFHGELALDQLFIARPVLEAARYATPIRGLFLCGTGSHPGSGLDGRAGRLAAHEIAAMSRRMP